MFNQKNREFSWNHFKQNSQISNCSQFFKKTSIFISIHKNKTSFQYFNFHTIFSTFLDIKNKKEIRWNKGSFAFYKNILDKRRHWILNDEPYRVFCRLNHLFYCDWIKSFLSDVSQNQSWVERNGWKSNRVMIFHVPFRAVRPTLKTFFEK